MKKGRGTKRALAMSVLAMVLCIAMLIGTTFAWFTDSVTSANNRIVAGNLDVELYYQNDEITEWTKVTSETNIFKDSKETLWEPGHTEVIKLKIANEGSLALKYQLGVNIASEIGSINVEGDPFKLSDYIYFGVAEGDQTYKDRDSAVASVAKDAFKIKEGYTKASSLEADEDAYLTMVVYMPTTVGNEANYAKGAAEPVINLGLNLFATQFTSEEDSFDNQYDKDAVYADAYATTAADLAEALAEGGTVALMNDITLADQPIALSADAVIDLNGFVLSGTSSSSASSNLINVPAGKILTLKNGTVTFEAGNPDTDWGDTGSKPFPGYANNTINCAGTLIIDGATIVNTTAKGGASYAIDCYPGADLIVNDGVVDGKDKIAIRMFANSYTVPTNVTINGGVITGYRAVWVQLPSANATKLNPVNLTVNGGTLISTDTQYNQAIYSYSYGDNFSGTTITLNGGKYYGDVALGGGVKNGAENITVNEENCKFYGEFGVYTYNTESGFAGVAPNATGGVVTDAETLNEQIDKGGDIILLNDIVLDSSISKGNANFVLDGNGCTISMAPTRANNIALFDITGGSITIQNVTFDGIQGGAVLRTVGATTILENVTIQNSVHTKDQGLLRLLGDATIRNSVFKDNQCTMVISFNFDANGSATTQLVIENCVFENNICGSTAVVYYAEGGSATFNANKFVNNAVTSDGNAATVYLGFTKNNTVTNNVFANNQVTTTGTTKRAAGALMLGYEAIVTGNAFVGNTVVGENAKGNDVCASVYYTDINLSGNYWGGDAPVENDDYFVEYPDRHDVIINDYLTVYNQ